MPFYEPMYVDLGRSFNKLSGAFECGHPSKVLKLPQLIADNCPSIDRPDLVIRANSNIKSRTGTRHPPAPEQGGAP
jgi:hypothetical protein